MKLPSITESTIQTGLMLGAGAAGAANGWGHVLDLATKHGQAGWHAWSVAVCIETAALSAGLELRRRRRLGQPLHLVEAVLVAAVALQLGAQLAQAEPTIWGRIVAAVPTLTFLTLAKLALVRSTDPIDSIESADPIGAPIDSIESTGPVDPIEADTSGESTAIDSIDPAPIDSIGSTRPIESARSSRSIEELRAEFDRLVTAGELTTDSPVETTRKILKCSPDRARIILGRKAA